MADSISLSWICASNKNHDAQTTIIIMSQDSKNKKDKPQQDVGDATDNTEIISNETGDIMKPGPKGIAKNKKTTISAQN